MICNFAQLAIKKKILLMLQFCIAYNYQMTKRAVAPSSATPSVLAKRGKEVVKNNSGIGHAKKRSRKSK